MSNPYVWSILDLQTQNKIKDSLKILYTPQISEFIEVLQMSVFIIKELDGSKEVKN